MEYLALGIVLIITFIVAIAVGAFIGSKAIGTWNVEEPIIDSLEVVSNDEDMKIGNLANMDEETRKLFGRNK